MKTENQWVEWRAENQGVSDAECYKQIQADALQHAEKLCEQQYEPRAGEDEDYSNGHANRGVGNCQNAIRQAITSLGISDGNAEP